MNAVKNQKTVKTCNNHVGGKLGELLMESFIDKGWIGKDDVNERYYHITEIGQKGFSKLGIDLNQVKE
jgi:hypothetical protein